MHILLVEDRLEAETPFLKTLDRVSRLSVVRKAGTLQEGIEILEKHEDAFDLVICDYHGASNVLLIGFFGLLRGVPCVFGVDDEPSRLALASQFQSGGAVKIVLRSKVQVEFAEALDDLIKIEALKDLRTPDSEFAPAPLELLAEAFPFYGDIYLRVGENRYCRLLRPENGFSASDFSGERLRSKIHQLHLRTGVFEKLLERQRIQLEALASAETADDETLERHVEIALVSLQTLVERMGFTPAARKLAKASVHATLRLIGARPQLAAILRRLKQDEGKYITAHSLALAQSACALAHRIGWSSAPTFFKLTLSAFLHDLPVRNNLLARCRTLAEAREAGFSADELRAFKMHPVLAAKYAGEFNEIPPDVDLILLQHHERPDGSGFPRGLLPARLAPLSCLFIIAHDLIHFAMHEGMGYPEQFFSVQGDLYNSSHFKKIMKALQTGSTVESGGKL